MTVTTRPAPAEPPLVTRLVDAHGAARLDEASFDAFVRGPGVTALFFTEDPVRFREVTDVAVILPELVAAASRRFRIGVLPPPLANARAATTAFAAGPRWHSCAMANGWAISRAFATGANTSPP